MKIKECSTCQGYGMWSFGLYTSMGELDSKGGIPTLPCPSCGSNANPINNQKQNEE